MAVISTRNSEEPSFSKSNINFFLNIVKNKNYRFKMASKWMKLIDDLLGSYAKILFEIKTRIIV